MASSDYISIISALFAGAAALFTFLQAKHAKKAVEQENHIRLFEAFEENSTRLFNHPSLLTDVHGYPIDEYSDQEARAIAYLCSFIDAFQLFYDKKYSGDFTKMADELINETSYFSKLLLRPENQKRYASIKTMFYGDYDRSYLNAIDHAINHYSTYHISSTSQQAPSPG